MASSIEQDREPAAPEVAHIAVDVPLAHLDRVFDYAVPEALADGVRPGVRVRVRFAGRLVDGIVVGLGDGSEHRLQPVQRVVSPLPVATPEIVETARAVADRYGGTLADVLRQAIPPRHARAEKRVLQSPVDSPSVTEDANSESAGAGAWARYRGGSALLERLAEGTPARAIWNALPGEDPPARIATLVAAVAARGGSAVVVVPDARDVERLAAAVTAHPGSSAPPAILTADQGPEARYAAFLRVLTRRTPVVIGTRAAAFAPVDLIDAPGLLICWEDGEDSLAEPHAPGWHAREVLALRAHRTGASLIVGGYARSVTSQAWIESGWAAAVTPRREVLRSVAPRVGADDEPGRDPGPRRLPGRALEVIRGAVRGGSGNGGGSEDGGGSGDGGAGPVLVQVARRGYVPGLVCQGCRRPARCRSCGAGLAIRAGSRTPHCGSCGADQASWRCPGCGSDRLRAVAVGSERTAEELQRAFPEVPVRWSGGGDVVDRIPATPAIVVATPGAEPWADGGFAAIVLLDAWAHLARADLRAGEEAVRRWFAAAALARPRAPVVVTAPGDLPAVQALIRWDPGWFAARELAERSALGLPPAVRAAQITGAPEAVAAALAEMPAGARILGPVPMVSSTAPQDVDARERDHVVKPRERAHVTVPRERGPELAAACRRIAAQRTARKAVDRLDLRIDPPDWGSA